MGANTPLRISVLIPTLGRKKELLDTLKALQSQTRLPDEIVVVDQNVPPFSEVVEFCALDPKIKHVKTPVRGVSNNYNLALKSATGDIVLYLDDDILPDPRLIEMHLGHYHYEDARPDLGGVAGRVSQPTGDQDPAAISIVGRYHPWRGSITANFNATRAVEVEIAPGGNMSFWRKVLLSSGGFDLGFDGNGYFFETDASLRVTKAGYRIVFEPLAYVKHLMAPSGGARITDKAQHTYYFVKNGIRLYRRHSPGWALPGLLFRSVAYVVAKAAVNHDFRILWKGFAAIYAGLALSLEIQK